MTITKGKNNFLACLPKKINIRWAILVIILPLLIGLSALIILINYRALNSVLILAAHDSLSRSCDKVSEQVSNYLTPLNNNITLAFHILKSNVVKVNHSYDFTKFLHTIIINDENIHGAFWGDINGNFYWLRKAKDGNLYEQIVLRNGRGDNKHIENIFDSNLKLLRTKKLHFDGIDPRSRPWFKRAQTKKQLTWIIYKFLEEAGEGEPLGVTAAFPLYDSRGNLLGVFGMDMLLEQIYTYINEITVTPNSVVFVADDIDDLISVHRADRQFLEDYELMKISELKKPWIKKSLAIFHKSHQLSFMFSLDNKQYVSAYDEIINTRSGSPWFVAIVAPLDDMTTLLRRTIIIAIMIVSLACIVGVILVSIFSSIISRPIRILAQNAHLVCQLRFNEVKKISSLISEILEVDKSFIKMKNALSSFQLYIPADLVKKIVASNKVAVVGGEIKELTLIFTDIQDFTRLSENINPEELMQFLSNYFHAITRVIAESYGTVDKYLGDGVMAFWGELTNDLKHAQYACQAALKIQTTLKQLNNEWQLENKPIITTRIGINTGNVVVGNVGSGDRLNYTLLGDSVNLASRLEGLSKIYGTSTIVSEFTYNQVKDKFRFRLLDKVAVKGKNVGVYIYELLGDLTAGSDLKLEQYNQKFLTAFSYYEKGAWQKARELFESLNKDYPEDIVIKLFISRCSVFNVTSPENWNGVWIMNEKF